MTKDDRRWPWFQQVLDGAAAAVGLGIAVGMAVRNDFQLAGIVLVALCIGKLTTSGLLRYLTGRWEDKP